MSIKKILAFSGIRSDYDLLSGMFKLIVADPSLDFKLIVSGAHLSSTYGFTIQHIESDGIPILARIESLIDSNTTSSRLKSLSILLQSCIPFVEEYKPDVILYAGDREDVIVGGLVGSYLNIPTIHFFGGDHAVDGNVDNSIRHATSKLSSIHFVSHPEHRDRLLKVGESDDRIYVIGNPSIDKFVNTPYISKDCLMKKLKSEEFEEYAILIFHPILGAEKKAGLHFETILRALKHMSINTFVSYPNTDSGNRSIIDVIDRWSDNDSQFRFFKSLDRVSFVNLFRHSTFLIGNSSAGIMETPFLKKPVINVGDRQKGRLSAGNVLYADNEFISIESAIQKVISDEFKDFVKMVNSPYGYGKSCEKAYSLLKELDFSSYRFKREDPLL